MQTLEKRKEEGGSAKDARGEVQIERFTNKDHNFSVSWYPDLKSLYQYTMEAHLSELEKVRKDNLKK